MIDFLPAAQSSQHVDFLGSPVLWNDEENVLAYGLHIRVPEHAFGATVPRGDGAVQRFADDRVVRRIDDGRQPRPDLIGRRVQRYARLVRIHFGAIKNNAMQPSYVILGKTRTSE